MISPADDVWSSVAALQQIEAGGRDDHLQRGDVPASSVAVCVRTSSVNAALVTTSKLRSYLKSSPGLLMISSRRPSRSASGSVSRSAASSTSASGVIVMIEVVVVSGEGTHLLQASVRFATQPCDPRVRLQRQPPSGELDHLAPERDVAGPAGRACNSSA